jgi:hypothetical protein
VYTIATIVEGHGEVDAVPGLLRRVLHARAVYDVAVSQPIRVNADQFKHVPKERNRFLELAARDARPDGAVLVLLDSDDECPRDVAPPLLAEIRLQIPYLPTALVLAYREYESWFLAAARSLRGKRNLPVDLDPPVNVEAIRGAKGWLQEQMGRKYRETADQAALTEVFSLDEARSTDSFDKLMREIDRLLVERDGANA